MNRALSVLALTGALALGAFVGSQWTSPAVTTPVSAADQTAVSPADQSDASTTPSTPTPLPTLAAPAQNPAQNPAASAPGTYQPQRARTESELNTVQVVRERQDGLVYISVTGGSPEQSELRRRLQEQLPFSLPEDDGGQSGTGSGFFINSAGDIITNNHVVEDASEITIRLHGSRATYPARVVARAPDFDLALIRAEGLPSGAVQPLPLGDSTQLSVGLKAIAMGAPFGLDFSVSEGIISSLERRVPVGSKNVLQSVIQTDAAINPGNSGGPLLDSAGRVIGVNTQILTGGSSQSAGVGFAIPVNTLRRLLPQLQSGSVSQPKVIQTPSLGIVFGDASEVSAEERAQYRLPDAGAVVSRVYPGSPAERAGLRGGTVSGEGASRQRLPDGDVITAVDGQALTDSAKLPTLIIGRAIGDTVTLTVSRAGQTREVRVKLTAFDLAKATQQAEE